MPTDGEWRPTREDWEAFRTRSYDEVLDEVTSPITGRATWYSPEGEPLSLRQWTLLRMRPDWRDFKFVAKTEWVFFGLFVSTVYIGMDHSFMFGPGSEDNPILIYETMVFSRSYEDLDQDLDRYSTREQAELGHRLKVAELTTLIGPPDPYPYSGRAEQAYFHTPRDESDEWPDAAKWRPWEDDEV